MSRVSGWQQLLADEFRGAQRRSFRWGRHDCCMFVARCVRAVSGQDKRKLFDRYRCKSEALEILAALGGMRNLLIRAFGDPKPVAFASAGDIVLIDMGRGEQPAVCMGLNCYAPGPRGLVPKPTANAVAAWTV